MQSDIRTVSVTHPGQIPKFLNEGFLINHHINKNFQIVHSSGSVLCENITDPFYNNLYEILYHNDLPTLQGENLKMLFRCVKSGINDFYNTLSNRNEPNTLSNRNEPISMEEYCYFTKVMIKLTGNLEISENIISSYRNDVNFNTTLYNLAIQVIDTFDSTIFI